MIKVKAPHSLLLLRRHLILHLYARYKDGTLTFLGSFLDPKHFAD